MKNIFNIRLLLGLLFHGSGANAQSSDWRYIGQTDTTFLKIQVTGTPGNWLISDIAPVNPGSGYSECYYVNDITVRNGKLTNHPFPANGVLDVKKWLIKNSLGSVENWQDGGPPSDPNGGRSGGVAGGYGGQSIILFYADDNKPGVQWLDRTPFWYTGDYVVSWPSKAPPMTLPASKFMIFDFRGGGYSDAQRMARGETSTPNNPNDQYRTGRVYGAQDLGLNSNLSQSQVEALANGFHLTGDSFFEYSEGAVSIANQGNQSYWWLSKLRQRVNAMGWNKYLLGGGYGMYDFEANNIWPNKYNNIPIASIRWRYTGDKNELYAKDPILGRFKDALNTINIKNYGSRAEDPYDNAMRIAKWHSIRKAGYIPTAFTWSLLERPGGLAYGGDVFPWQIKKSDGSIVYRREFSTQVYDDAVAQSFASLWYADGFKCWDFFNRNHNPNTVDNPAQDGSRYPTPDVAIDAHYIGASLYAQTNPTEGGTIRFNGFTIDNVSYPAEADGADPLLAYDQKRGLCSIRQVGNTATIVY